MKWLAGIGIVIAALAAFFWWAALDAAAPAEADGLIDIAAYRELVANDTPETLPTAVNVDFVGESKAPSFAVESGAFDGQRTLSYNSFQIVSPSGDTIIDGAVDRQTLDDMSQGKGSFNEQTYEDVLATMTRAQNVMITHEHLDHVMAIARHPEPAAIARNLQLTAAQLAGLPEHAPNGQLAPEIAGVPQLDLSQPQRIAPGIVAVAMPGHSPGTILIYAKTAEREYLFIGDIAWVIGSVEHLRGRPRFITWLMPGVDPGRANVLRQLRALHDLSGANPELVLVPAHDDTYLRGLVSSGVMAEGFTDAAAIAAPVPE
jgi:glyoxylase-like metal-dependent hydrolase (beta-lactamase superfamily II)